MDAKDRAAEALRDEFHDLRKWAEQAVDALKKEREAHAETNRAMTDALLTLEERERWYTPAHVMFGWTQRLQRRHQPDEEHPIPITTEPTAAREPVQFGLFEEQRAA